MAAIGEVSMATTQILADQFDLSNDELLNGLPLIDMSKTKFWSICPLLVKQDIKCELSRFRTQTGHCNNLKHPTWGAAMTPFARYLPPVHPDGIWIPRKSIVTEITFDLTAGHRELHSDISPTVARPVFNDYHQLNHERVQFRGATGMAASSSVQFVRHAQLDAPESGFAAERLRTSEGQTASRAASQVPSASVSFPAGQLAPIPPPIGERIVDTHYQQSHSPSQPYLATSGPIGAQQQQQPLSAEASIQRGHKSRAMPAELPSPRLVTSIVHRDIELPSHDFSILFMSWGQLLDHDMTRAAQPPPSE